MRKYEYLSLGEDSLGPGNPQFSEGISARLESLGPKFFPSSTT
jgi:hypothetical protein